MDTKKRKSETLTSTTNEAFLSSRRRCPGTPDDEWRDWASLPWDVLCIVLCRLREQIDILRRAGLVCSRWRRAAQEEALLWRDIDLSEGRQWPPAGWKAMSRVVVDRSAGKCESFMGHVDADVLVHLAKSAPLLTHLSVARWPYILDVNEIIKKLPLLERLVLWSGEFQEELLLALLDHCPRLELLEASHCWPMRQGWKKSVAMTRQLDVDI